MFIGRKREMSWLNEQYLSSRFEMSIVYGRRRVGKTTLLQNFIAGKRAIYFLATQASNQMNLDLLSESIYKTTNPGMTLPAFLDYESAFRFVAQQAKHERLLLIIDEYPYLAAGEPSISSILQRCIDLYFKQSQGFLVLCGSSMSFMEQQVLSEKSPLYGRRTAQYKICPFSFQECCEYFSDQHSEAKAIYFGVTGGVAEYMSFIDPARSVDENIIRLYFEHRGRLYEEPSNLLNQELRDPRIYNDILAAIASGSSKNNEIATKVQMTSANLNPYLKSLIELHIVSKTQSVGKQGSTKPIYAIDDRMYRFWYRFVHPYRRYIEINQGSDIYFSVVKDQLPTFMGPVFEQIVLEYMSLPDVRHQLPKPVVEDGRWWGTDPAARREVKIDYVGLASETTLLGEAKWRNGKLNRSVLSSLQEKGQLLKGDKIFFLFSKGGFSADLIDRAKTDDNLYLVDYEQMVETFMSSS